MMSPVQPTTMRTHELKTDPEVFQAVQDRLKTYEIRKNDRGFAVGDLLVLRETLHTGRDMARGSPLVYTGRVVQAAVTHILTGPIYGLPAGWSILSLAPPAPVQPLTDEQILTAANCLPGWLRYHEELDCEDLIGFARAIEQAHGITGLMVAP